ncbi:hypothetical protein SAMN05192551_102106 [Tindallia magadiensis]|uniref:Uncharacterized protein n=1 Tax=Tindallia magadiensis TaxID=69895 RepID=A0A1I3BYS4_9FIRM|nr:hypothetical protein SAMN05192551_102106 [Tindallia magadiensis]
MGVKQVKETLQQVKTGETGALFASFFCVALERIRRMPSKGMTKNSFKAMQEQAIAMM